MAVGQLISGAIEKCRRAHPRVDCSVTEGEHSSDPRSIDFFQQWGVNSISCAGDKVPLARICAAQAAIRADIRGKLRV